MTEHCDNDFGAPRIKIKIMMEAPICPVCGLTLRATGVNPNMYYCTKRKVWVSDLWDAP